MGQLGLVTHPKSLPWQNEATLRSPKICMVPQGCHSHDARFLGVIGQVLVGNMPKALECHPARAMNWREDHPLLMHCSTHQIGCHRPGDNQYEAVASPSILEHHHISDVKIIEDKTESSVVPFPRIAGSKQGMDGNIYRMEQGIRLDRLIRGVTTTGRSVAREISLYRQLPDRKAFFRRLALPPKSK
jgi:hypothetical protein